MNKELKILPVITVISIGILLMATFIVLCPQQIGRRIGETIFSLIEDTEYCEGYSEKLFDQIKIGDDVETVKKNLPKPLLVLPTSGNTMQFRYTRSPTSTHYKMRAILFEDGLVIKKWKYNYID